MKCFPHMVFILADIADYSYSSNFDSSSVVCNALKKVKSKEEIAPIQWNQIECILKPTKLAQQRFAKQMK